MITYEALACRPAAFRSFTGHSVEAFAALLVVFTPAYEAWRRSATTTRRGGLPRQRAVGAGACFAHDLRTRLLMALVWLRIYPTYEVLGFLFSLDKTNVHATVQDVLAVLETLAEFPFERPSPARKKLRSLAAVMEAFPEVCLIIDAKEQPVERPKSSKEDDQQRPYYSGKKKRHTLKNQIAVTPDGRIGAVSESVPGGENHDLTVLRGTRLLERLDPEEGAMLDKGYQGIHKDYPEKPLYLPCKAQKNRPLTDAEKEYNRHLARHRIVVEHTNAQLNQFQCLAQRYRHTRERHSRVFRVVAYLVDRRIAEQPLKSYPTA
jgi:hypothetical protein